MSRLTGFDPKTTATANRDEDPAVPKAANSLSNSNYGNYGRVFNDFDGFSGKRDSSVGVRAVT